MDFFSISFFSDGALPQPVIYLRVFWYGTVVCPEVNEVRLSSGRTQYEKIRVSCFELLRATSGVGRGGGKGPGCGFKFAGSRTRSHIFSGFAALKTIRSRVLNYGNYHGQVCDN